LFDNNLSPKIVDTLCALGATAVHLRSLFPADTDDVDWIPKVAADGWVVVTVDHCIRTRPHEREVWRKSGVCIFFLPKGVLKMRLFEQASWIVGAWEMIQTTAASARPGQGFLVQQNKKIERLP
jgi:hypothetical protein